MRALDEMLAGAPCAPGGDADGFPLHDLDARECRFPTASGHEGHRFCAMPVEPAAWQPGKVNGCYCAFHRGFAARQAADDQREPAL